MAMAERKEVERVARMAMTIGLLLSFVVGLYYAGKEAYKIRLYAIKTYGRVIHEFDPWFNYRATEYMSEHGYAKFIKWFDTKSWYPLGRPVALHDAVGPVRAAPEAEPAAFAAHAVPPALPALLDAAS